MAIKMIVTDLDGTLLKTDKTVSEYTKTILRRCKESGIKLVYATGRGVSADRLAPQELFDGKITMNGAIAKVGEDIVYNRLIPYQMARPVLTACDEHGIKITSEHGGMHYSNFPVSDFWPTLTNFIITDFSQHELDAEKIYSPAPTPEQVAIIEKLLPGDIYSVITYDPTGDLLNIMHKEATKSKAVSALAQLWGILPEEIVAFGDDLNDLDMLVYAGVGVAMGNALDAVKAVADEVCGVNEHDGIAKWLEDKVL